MRASAPTSSPPITTTTSSCHGIAGTRRWRRSVRWPGSRPPELFRRLHQILRHAIAERPIPQRVLDEIDDHVFAPDADALVQTIGDELEEGLLDLVRPSLAQRHLD